MRFMDLLAALKVPPMSLHVQNIRANLHEKLTLITTFGFPVTNADLLKKLRNNISKDFMRNHPYATISDIYGAKYIQQEIYALEKRLDMGQGDGGAA